LPDPGFAGLYLSRYGSPLGDSLPDPDPDIAVIVVIPSFREKHLNLAIQSLIEADVPGLTWEILCVINHPEHSDRETMEINRQSLAQVKDMDAGVRKGIRILPLWVPDVPVKHAGVGWARKIGFDTAVSRFSQTGRPDGIIISFDADSICAPDFIIKLVEFYSTHPKARGCNHYFEHPLDEKETGDSSLIAGYELHLRYFKSCLEWIRHPQAIHTVGSSFSFRADAYCQSGGMGRHQAGEDFYFLHKIAALGQFWEHNGVTIMPSPRISDRVVFGTGATMQQLHQSGQMMETYPFELFQPLKLLFSRVDEIRELNDTEILALPQNHWCTDPLNHFLQASGLPGEWIRIRHHSSSPETYRRHFFHSFNVFSVLRYLNQSCRGGFQKVPVTAACREFSDKTGWMVYPDFSDPVELVRIFRKYEQNRGVRRVT